MTAAASGDLLPALDKRPLHGRYWIAVLGPERPLTYGESAIILLGIGVGRPVPQDAGAAPSSVISAAESGTH
jgi:hypothetical protein